MYIFRLFVLLKRVPLLETHGSATLKAKAKEVLWVGNPEGESKGGTEPFGSVFQSLI